METMTHEMIQAGRHARYQARMAKAAAAQAACKVGTVVEWTEAGLYRWAEVIAKENGHVCLEIKDYRGVAGYRLMPLACVTDLGSI